MRKRLLAPMRLAGVAKEKQPVFHARYNQIRPHVRSRRSAVVITPRRYIPARSPIQLSKCQGPPGVPGAHPTARPAGEAALAASPFPPGDGGAPHHVAGRGSSRLPVSAAKTGAESASPAATSTRRANWRRARPPSGRPCCRQIAFSSSRWRSPMNGASCGGAEPRNASTCLSFLAESAAKHPAAPDPDQPFLGQARERSEES